MTKPPTRKSGASEKLQSELDPFARELQKRVQSLVGRDQAAGVVAQVIALYQEEKFSGPIAHPRHLREYDDIVPGAADRIIMMAEKSLEHRQSLQARALDADIQDTKDGRRYGFCALAALIVAAMVTGLYGHEVLAGLFLGAGVLGTVGALINGRSNGNGSE